MIEVHGLVKRYGRFTAVDHLDFTVDKGQVCGFLGPNGAGKSTTMNILTGYLSPSEGSVQIDGFDILQQPERAKRQIGYLPEIPPLYPEMTAQEYLRFAAKLKGVAPTALAAEVARVAELAGVTQMKNRLIKNLSKGYRQRVGLACALLGDPAVIILDEPTVGLDPVQMIEMRKLIRMLGQEHTVILSSHILTEISSVCDHVIMISKGKLVASGALEGLGDRLQQGHTYDAVLRGTQDTVRKALADLPGVQEVRVQAQDDGTCLLHLESMGEKDPREALFYRLAAAQCPILELTSRAMDLEDIFLALTGGNAEGGEQQA